MRTMGKSKKLAFFALHFVLWLGVFALYIALIMWLWNWLVPAITGWSSINYLQAFVLFVLAHMLGGTLFHGGHRGMHHGGHGGPHHGGHGFGGRRHRMSREERREFFHRYMSEMRNENSEMPNEEFNEEQSKEQDKEQNKEQSKDEQQ